MLLALFFSIAGGLLFGKGFVLIFLQGREHKWPLLLAPYFNLGVGMALILIGLSLWGA